MVDCLVIQNVALTLKSSQSQDSKEKFLIIWKLTMR